jgi:hypothetical protein
MVGLLGSKEPTASGPVSRRHLDLSSLESSVAARKTLLQHKGSDGSPEGIISSHALSRQRALANISSGSRGRRVIPCCGQTDCPAAIRSSKFSTRLASAIVASWWANDAQGTCERRRRMEYRHVAALSADPRHQPHGRSARRSLGTTDQAGTLVVIAPYVLHRSGRSLLSTATTRESSSDIFPAAGDMESLTQMGGW